MWPSAALLARYGYGSVWSGLAVGLVTIAGTLLLSRAPDALVEPSHISWPRQLGCA